MRKTATGAIPPTVVEEAVSESLGPTATGRAIRDLSEGVIGLVHVEAGALVPRRLVAGELAVVDRTRRRAMMTIGKRGSYHHLD